MILSRTLTSFFLALTLLMSLSALAAEEPHSLVLVYLDSAADLDLIKANNNHLDILRIKPGQHVEIAARKDDLQFLKDSGLRLKVITENMEASYASQNKDAGFGVYHTYSESVAFCDSLHLLYPEVISEKWSIGLTHEGRDIWCFRVSDNPEVDENEPEILIDGMHHAREIMASEFPIMFAEYLGQNYGTDLEITYLLQNRELYIIPIINPDGVTYNEENYPSGGGMWRKNRRDNGDGTFGVDPNRNYPYQWAFDDVGSSGDTSSEVYRGTYAGSEPEVQALMNFINSRQIITHDSVHTFSNLLLFPWGWTSSDSPHHSTFALMGEKMTRFNGYEAGQPGDIIYEVNGGTNDWVYGDTSEHDMVYSFCSEIGGDNDGFWPAQERRGPLFEENIWPHIYLMRAAGSFVAAHSPVVIADAKMIAPGESGQLDFTIENQSVVSSSMGLDITITCDDAWVQMGTQQRSVGGLNAMESTNLGSNTLPISIDSACPDGHVVNFTVTAHMAEGDIDFDLNFVVGSSGELFTEDFEGGLASWTTTGNWNTTPDLFHSAANSLTDSPIGEYTDQSATSATINNTFQATSMSFWHRYDIESGYDYGRVQVSTNGTSWNTVASFDGLENIWQEVVVDFGAFGNENLQIRFMLDTDYSVTEDGWYIDDVAIHGVGSSNLLPYTPVALSPVGGELTTSSPVLTVSNVTDPEGETVDYGFRIYSDELGINLVDSVQDVIQGSGQTSWQVASLADGTYYWRAFADDGVERSLLSGMASFTVQSTSGVDGILINNPQLSILGNVTGGSAQMQLNLPSNSRVSVDIYDARGARIRQLHSGMMAGGSNALVWDGRDSGGRSASSGVYFVRVVAGDDVLSGRVVVVR